MIGELLAHLLVLEFNENLGVASPFFNLEERQPKKGFDLILYCEAGNRVWITEVKSGDAGGSGSDSKNRSLLNKARVDLTKRLNDSDRGSLWDNAINNARIALGEGKVREKIEAILEQGLSDTQDGVATSSNKTVILVSVLYSSLEDRISSSKVCEFSRELSKKKSFGGIMIFSIQKETYHRIAEFLEAEST